MARAKCQCCKKQLDTKEAFKVEVNGKNKYWCNEECYKVTVEEQERQAKIKAEYDEIFELTKEIFGYEFQQYSLLKREVDALNKLSTRQKIALYLKENKDWLSDVMDKEFQSDFHRVRYYMTIVSGKLHDWKPKVEVVEKPRVVVEIDDTIYEAPTHSLNKRRSLADLEDEIW